MIIALDIMGGDFAPEEAIKGVKSFFERNSDPEIRLALIGTIAVCRKYLPMLDNYQWRYTFEESTDVIGMNEHPTKALKEKPNSSIAVGYRLMAEDRADAFISAGNTGAMMVGAIYTLKTIEGILRPVIVSPIPREDGKHNLLLDVGANADCKPEYLQQFAELGSIYAEYIMGIKKPKVGLLNLGAEEGKGNLLAQAAYPLLKETKDINFIGNIEGRDIFLNKANVIVCEGFVGNVALKLAESIYDLFAVKKGFEDPLLDQFDFEMYGGTPVLGVNGPVVIGHGISHARAFHNMIDVASRIVSSKLVPALQARYAKQPTA